MTQKLYSVVDVKADIYSPPFVSPNHGVATRMFTELVNGPEGLPTKYPGDFKLVYIGEFDNETGIVLSGDFVTLGFGSDFIEKKATLAKIGGGNG